ncbi:Pyrimidine pathway regulatory protein 1 [Purpureocillium lavendulum]|uniref:Pyrimidine pathway regulatory protein 1 n=1 Tax=Purpureocillium lavendulum TaxID=1247861 RepID=A0AB34G4Y1_9HYPO|nr:Pyrimidine pathway regulatory protein 1 [Purpureocillium lavendulum]
MQPNAQQVHDDLASLFSRNLTFNPELRAAAAKDTPRQEPTPPVQSPPIVYSISQHYHHSAHAARPAAPEQQDPSPAQTARPSSEPPQSEAPSSETILRNFGIDAATLTPSQVQLFRIADEPQKLRLIELWSICPPNRGEDIHSLAWSSTTLEQEEHLARLRFEQQQQNQAMSLDGTSVQTGDGRWTHEARDTEPYMVSGYQELMRRETERNAADTMPRSVYSHFGTTVSGPNYTPATDPVYLGPDYVRQQQQMEMATQYGAFEQSRVVGDLDTMDVM